MSRDEMKRGRERETRMRWGQIVSLRLIRMKSDKMERNEDDEKENCAIIIN